MARLMAPATKLPNDEVVCSQFAFGLQIKSNLQIPGLPVVKDSDGDVYVHLGTFPQWFESSKAIARLRSASSTLDAHGIPTRRVSEVLDGRYFYYLYADGTEFILNREGTEVWSRWPSELTLEDAVTYLLGPIFGFLMRLRGFICLHASAVVIESLVTLFVGPAGAGKSTLAAAFANLGYAVVTDDVAVIVDRGDQFLVQPAYPRVRLWADSVSAFYGTEDSLPLITPNWDKRYLDLTLEGRKFLERPATLKQIFLLSERGSEEPKFEELAMSDKLMSLVANSYANYVLDKEMRRQEFELVSRLLDAVPVRRVRPPSDLSKLDEFCNSIIEYSDNWNGRQEFQSAG